MESHARKLSPEYTYELCERISHFSTSDDYSTLAEEVGLSKARLWNLFSIHGTAEQKARRHALLRARDAPTH